MIEWHKRLMEKYMESFGLNNYQVAWISFFKGIVITVLVYEFLMS